MNVVISQSSLSNTVLNYENIFDQIYLLVCYFTN